MITSGSLKKGVIHIATQPNSFGSRRKALFLVAILATLAVVGHYFYPYNMIPEYIQSVALGLLLFCIVQSLSTALTIIVVIAALIVLVATTFILGFVLEFILVIVTFIVVWLILTFLVD